MRDSRNGTFGVLALALSVLIKVACLTQFVDDANYLFYQNVQIFMLHSLKSLGPDLAVSAHNSGFNVSSADINSRVSAIPVAV